MPAYAPAYAWLHLLERCVRTWLALEGLVKQCLLPMGREGVRALDVGKGPGTSAFATHDFYAVMVKYAEISRKASLATCPTILAVQKATTAQKR